MCHVCSRKKAICCRSPMLYMFRVTTALLKGGRASLHWCLQLLVRKGEKWTLKHSKLIILSDCTTGGRVVSLTADSTGRWKESQNASIYGHNRWNTSWLSCNLYVGFEALHQSIWTDGAAGDTEHVSEVQINYCSAVGVHGLDYICALVRLWIERVWIRGWTPCTAVTVRRSLSELLNKRNEWCNGPWSWSGIITIK